MMECSAGPTSRWRDGGLDAEVHVVVRDDVSKWIWHFGLGWDEVRRRLSELEPPDEVWISSTHVVRITKRFPASLVHEVAVAQHLPDDVLYPRPIATGWEGSSFWAVAPRIPGQAGQAVVSG